MQQFIPLRLFKALFISQSALLDDGEIAHFIDKLDSEEGIEICEKQQISNEEFLTFKETFKNSQVIIFHGWIEQNDALLNLLTTAQLSEGFTDKSGVLKHQLSASFKQFISPYLADKLIPFSGQEDKTLKLTFSYVQLLDTDHRAVVEGELFKSIRGRIRNIDKSQKIIQKEQDLVNLVKPLCSDEVVFCVNALSKSSYALKISYVDTILNTIESPACTVRFANWIIKQLESIQLNKEHEDKLYELKTNLKKGNITVRNHGKGRTPVRLSRVISNIVLLLIVVAAGLFIYSKPFSEVKDVETKYASSFKVFTEEERKEIDSLLQTLDNGFKIEEPVSDPGIPLYSGGVVLQLRKSFNNQLMERIYDDLTADAEISNSYGLDSCEQKEVDFQMYPNVKKLSQRKGKYETEIKNKSEFDAILYVAEEKANGKVYSIFLKQDETLLISLNESDILTFVAGNHFSNFEFNQNIPKADLPSSDFKYHFCDTEVSYEESINTSFQLRSVPSKKIKLMLMGTLGSYFKVVDIYGNLESY